LIEVEADATASGPVQGHALETRELAKEEKSEGEREGDWEDEARRD